jgi:hypothetical protein
MLWKTRTPDRFTWRGLFNALTREPDRTLWLPILGALIGLCIAGIGLFRRAPVIVTSVPPGYVAMVNGKGILMSDFMAQVTDSNGRENFSQTTAAERNRVLHDMIDEELLVQRGLALDLPETTIEVRSVLDAGVDTQVAQPALSAIVTEQELRDFYQSHRTDFTTTGSMNVRDIVLHVGGYQNANQTVAQAETDATEAAYQLRAGADPDYVMNHFGFVDSGRMDGTEQLDFAAKLHLGDKLFQIARALEDGQVSDPVTDADGVHLLIMQRRIPERVADFDSVRDKVYSEYKDSERRRAAEENLAILRREAHIVLAPGAGE